MTRKEAPAPGSLRRPRRSWLLAAVIGVLCVGAGIYSMKFHGLHPQDDPSFHYGQKVMDRDVYPTLHGGSIENACRNAIRNAQDKPRSLDISKAVSGCIYEEYALDN